MLGPQRAAFRPVPGNRRADIHGRAKAGTAAASTAVYRFAAFGFLAAFGLRRAAEQVTQQLRAALVALFRCQRLPRVTLQVGGLREQ